ncbi:uncharacterized protein I206_106347 [Kwoniella pini CBS 10737]|uniref:Uncharacterized protein n=1 Tax=Kwoniella pini CBS 10737 TaxID=1296096 RepID=A0A1B9HU16_9TREE|nr:uncharacterized protein I206_07149 [Kwoniella pini CBS 10737]OCF46762.1 hypothetical protein I206_07149 [Kwoniella pini CBS 10737]
MSSGRAYATASRELAADKLVRQLESGEKTPSSAFQLKNAKVWQYLEYRAQRARSSLKTNYDPDTLVNSAYALSALDAVRIYNIETTGWTDNDYDARVERVWRSHGHGRQVPTKQQWGDFTKTEFDRLGGIDPTDELMRNIVQAFDEITPSNRSWAEYFTSWLGFEQGTSTIRTPKEAFAAYFLPDNPSDWDKWTKKLESRLAWNTLVLSDVSKH